MKSACFTGHRRLDTDLNRIRLVRCIEKAISKGCDTFICGGALGVLGMYTMADFPASDLLSAAAVGISSGLAATGANEAIKIVKN